MHTVSWKLTLFLHLSIGRGSVPGVPPSGLGRDAERGVRRVPAHRPRRGSHAQVRPHRRGGEQIRPRGRPDHRQRVRDGGVQVMHGDPTTPRVRVYRLFLPLELLRLFYAATHVIYFFCSSSTNTKNKQNILCIDTEETFH